MHFWMFYAILNAQKNFHPKFFWVKQGATQCYQAFLVSLFLFLSWDFFLLFILLFSFSYFVVQVYGSEGSFSKVGDQFTVSIEVLVLYPAATKTFTFSKFASWLLHCASVKNQGQGVELHASLTFYFSLHGTISLRSDSLWKMVPTWGKRLKNPSALSHPNTDGPA